ncbi:phage tail assembly protein [Rhodospirillum sp. A1_3_36]|uniref:phage tail assembly protein n=1 Tax=Rhodospirillum sp. A1_3_36 TaxID=3391666 RepID=UPI0039A60F2C
MITVTLTDGLTVGDVTHTEVELRKLSAGDILDATEAAERAVATPAGWVLLVSDARAGVEILRRQIARIGDHKGPLSLAEFRKLSEADLGIIRNAATHLDAAQVDAEALAARGRSEGAGKTA